MSSRYSSSAKYVSLPSIENNIVSVYYANYPMTLYFQIQFIRVSCIYKKQD